MILITLKSSYNPTKVNFLEIQQEFIFCLHCPRKHSRKSLEKFTVTSNANHKINKNPEWKFRSKIALSQVPECMPKGTDDFPGLFPYGVCIPFRLQHIQTHIYHSSATTGKSWVWKMSFKVTLILWNSPSIKHYHFQQYCRPSPACSCLLGPPRFTPGTAGVELEHS